VYKRQVEPDVGGGSRRREEHLELGALTPVTPNA
jgi:hypothetical protein